MLLLNPPTYPPVVIYVLFKGNGCMKRGMPAENNVANLIAIGVTATGLLQERWLFLADALCSFLEVKCLYLSKFQSVFGEEEVYFPDSHKNINFNDPNLLRAPRMYLRDHGICVEQKRIFLVVKKLALQKKKSG